MDDGLVLSVAEACEAARCSRAALYREIGAGRLTARKRGRRTLILRLELENWLRALPPMPRRAYSQAGV